MSVLSLDSNCLKTLQIKTYYTKMYINNKIVKKHLEITYK